MVMMRRRASMKRVGRRAPVVGVLAIALVVTAASVALADLRGSGHEGIVTKQTLKMPVKNEVFSESNVGPSALSVGDTFFVQADLYNSAGTRKVGRWASVCVLADVATALNHCEATAFLRGGKVEVSGSVFFTEAAQALSYAVVGGTGKYDNVVGQATLRFRPEAIGDLLTLQLIPSFRRP
jgi:hypothetical protein